MRETKGDIWDFHSRGKWVVVPTNGDTNSHGNAIMGKGLALQATTRFATLPRLLGEKLILKGNHLFIFDDFRVITLPVKNHYWEKADLSLIESSCIELDNVLGLIDTLRHELRHDERIRELETEGLFESEAICLPHLGCGSGQLSWSEVKPVLERTLTSHDSSFVICDLN